MRLQQQNRGGRFVNFARFDADQTVLDVIDAAHAMLAADLVQAVDELHAVHILRH